MCDRHLHNSGDRRMMSASDSALVVIDPQKAFVDARGSLARMYGQDEIGPNGQALARLLETLARMRAAEAPVILVRSEYRTGQFAGDRLDSPLSHLCVPGANLDCEWADGLVVTPADIVVTKSSEDAFASAAFRARVRSLVDRGVRVLYFAGYQLTTCVKATALSSARAFDSTPVRSVVLQSVTGARASSYHTPQGGRSRVENTYLELTRAGVEIAPSPFEA